MPKVRGGAAKPASKKEPETADESTTEQQAEEQEQQEPENTETAEEPADKAEPEPKAEEKPRKRVRKRADAEPPKPTIDAADIELTDLDTEPDYASVLIYGREGTRKTTSALKLTNLPDSGNVLVINAEGGLKTAALRSHGVDTGRIKLWPKRGQRVTFDALEALFYRVADDLEKDPDSWAGVVWDSITEIYKTLIDVQVDTVMDKQSKLGAKGVRTQNHRERFDVVRDDYSVMSQQVRQLMRKFRYLPCHFVITALERRAEDEDTKRVRYGPNLNPALQSDVMAYVDIVMRNQVDNDGLGTGDTRPTKRQHAKERYNVLPGELVDPTMDRVVAYIRGELTPDTDPVQRALAAQSGATDPEPESAEDGKTEPTEEDKPEAEAKKPARRKSRAATAASKTDEAKKPTRRRVQAAANSDDPPF